MEESTEMDAALIDEIFRMNPIESLCDRHEMEWPVIGQRLKMMNVFRLLLSRNPLFGT
jgi:hypothetical protein